MQDLPDWAEPQVREYQSHNNENGPPNDENCVCVNEAGKCIAAQACKNGEGGTPVPIDGTVFQAALIIAGLIVGAFMLSKNDHDSRRSRSKNGCSC